MDGKSSSQNPIKRGLVVLILISDISDLDLGDSDLDLDLDLGLSDLGLDLDLGPSGLGPNTDRGSFGQTSYM